MKLKECILKGIISVLLVVITALIDIMFVKIGKRFLWLICGYVLYWIWEVED